MTLHTMDGSGDWLPAAGASRLVTGSGAVAQLVCFRLRLLTGDWWENPEMGCRILEMFREKRVTEANAALLREYLTAYMLETPEVRSVEEAELTVTGREILFSCKLVTAYGEETMREEIAL